MASIETLQNKAQLCCSMLDRPDVGGTGKAAGGTGIKESENKVVGNE